MALGTAEHVEFLRAKGVPGLLNEALSAAFRLRPADPRAFFASYMAADVTAVPPRPVPRSPKVAAAADEVHPEELSAYVNRTGIAGLVNAAVRELLQHQQDQAAGADGAAADAALTARDVLHRHFLRSHYIITSPVLSSNLSAFTVLAEVKAARVYGRTIAFEGPSAKEVLMPTEDYHRTLGYSPCLKYRDMSFDRYAAAPARGAVAGGTQAKEDGDACEYAVVTAAAPAAVLEAHTGITAQWLEDVLHDCGRLPQSQSLPQYPLLKVAVAALDPLENALAENAVPKSPQAPSDTRRGTKCGCSVYRVTLYDCSDVDPVPFASPYVPASEFIVKIWGPGTAAAACAARERTFYTEVAPLFARLPARADGSTARALQFPPCYWAGVSRTGGTLLLGVPPPTPAHAPCADASSPAYWKASVEALATQHAAFLDPVRGLPAKALPLWTPNYAVSADVVEASGAGGNAVWSVGAVAGADVWGGPLTPEKRALLRRGLVRVLQWTGRDAVWEAHGAPHEIAAAFDSLFEEFPRLCTEGLSPMAVVNFSQLLYPTGTAGTTPVDTTTPPPTAADAPVPADTHAGDTCVSPARPRAVKDANARRPHPLSRRHVQDALPPQPLPFLPGSRPATHPLNTSEWSVGHPVADVVFCNYAAWLESNAPPPMSLEDVAATYYVKLRDELLAHADARTPASSETAAALLIQGQVRKRHAQAEAARRRARGGVTLRKDNRKPAAAPLAVASLEEEAAEVMHKFVMRLQAKLEAARRKIAQHKLGREAPRTPQSEQLLSVPPEMGAESDREKNAAAAKIQRRAKGRLARAEAERRRTAGKRQIVPATPEAECMIVVEEVEGTHEAVLIQRQVRARQARQEVERKMAAVVGAFAGGAGLKRGRQPAAPPVIIIDEEERAQDVIAGVARVLLAKAEVARRRIARRKAAGREAARAPTIAATHLPEEPASEQEEAAAAAIQKQYRRYASMTGQQMKPQPHDAATLGAPQMAPDEDAQARAIQRQVRLRQARQEKERRAAAQGRGSRKPPRQPEAAWVCEDPEDKAVGSIHKFAVGMLARNEAARRRRVRDNAIGSPRAAAVQMDVPEELPVQGLPQKEDVDFDFRICSVFVIALHVFSKMHTWLPALDTFTDDDVLILAHKGGVRWHEARGNEPCVPELSKQLTLAQWYFRPTIDLPDGTTRCVKDYRASQNIHDVFYTHVLVNRPAPRPESKPIPQVDLKQPIRAFREFFEVCCKPFARTVVQGARVNLVPLRMLVTGT